MAHTLGIDLGAEVTVAAVADGAGRVRVLRLGEDRTATSSAVLHRSDGSTVVGDAAVRLGDETGELITDPLARLAGGDSPSATIAVIAHVIGRAVTALGSAPERVAAVHPDAWDTARRDRLLGAIRAAGGADAAIVTDRDALASGVRIGEPMAALAAGCATVAASRSAPLVTREDLGDTAPPRSSRPTPPAPEVTPPASVFDSALSPPAGADPPDGPRPAPPAVAATSVMPPVRPSPGPRTMSLPERRFPVGVVVGGVALLAAAVVVALVLAADRGGDDAVTTAASSTTAASIPSTTTEAATTTATSTSTTSTSSSSTTSTSTTTSSSTTSTSTTTSSTTTVPVPVASPGPVTLVETGLKLDTGTVLLLGQDGDAVVDSIVGVLGAPGSDMVFEDTFECLGTRTRFVRWGDLEVVIDVDSEGAGPFTQWYTSGSDDPPGLVTIDGVGVGATVGLLQVNYGSAFELAEAIESVENVGAFALTNGGSGGTLVGLTDGFEPAARITDLWAGDGCLRFFP